MKDFKDRQPTKANRRKITRENGAVEYVTVEMADEPTATGTPLNRITFMAMQGFEAIDTTFGLNGNITETNTAGDTLVTSFLADGSIVETFTGSSGDTITKTTTFQADGSIREVVS